MSKIDKDELFGHLSSFLKTKGVELQEGTYTQRIQKACGLVAETANMSQQAMERAKSAVDKGLNQVRQVIHEKTAPKAPPAPPTPSPAAPQPPKASAAPRAKKPKSAKAKSAGKK